MNAPGEPTTMVLPGEGLGGVGELFEELGDERRAGRDQTDRQVRAAERREYAAKALLIALLKSIEVARRQRRALASLRRWRRGP